MMLKPNMSQALEVKDLYRLAKAYVPRMFFQYVDSGSFTEQTYRSNESDFSPISMHQRVLRDVSTRSLANSFFGQPCSLPVVLGPVGMVGMQRADGEILAAKAAKQFQVPFCLSNMSVSSMEDVWEATHEPFFYQLYMMKDREYMSDQIRRCKEVQARGLILTVDLPVLGQRHRDIRNHLKAPPPVNLDTISQFASKPRWCLDMLTAKRWHYGNIKDYVKDSTNLETLLDWIAQQFVQNLSLNDLEWLKQEWDGPLLVKGILHKDDAVLAAEVVDGIIVSNHGGRQLDGARSSISLLKPICDAVKDFRRTKKKPVGIFVDGGFRTGQDIVKALCLGADSVFLGRSYVYGVGAGGEEGVLRCLQILEKEIDTSIALMGVPDVKNLSIENIAYMPPHYYR